MCTCSGGSAQCSLSAIIIIIDSILQQMESISLASFFAGPFLGASAHAGDVQTMSI